MALQYAMMRDAEQESDKFKLQAMIQNPQMYEVLFGSEPAATQDIEWRRPETAEEMDDIVSILEGIQTGGELP